MRKRIMPYGSLVMVACLAVSALPAQQTLHTRSEYKLHSGDTVSLDYRLSPELDQTVTLGPDGFVDLSIAGSVHLAGLTIQQAHDIIIARDAERLLNPELTIQLRDFQKTYVVVAGQVQTPGKIEMREDMTAIQAVMLAGGFRDSAKESKIVLFHRLTSNSDMAEVRVLNLHRVNKTKDLERDISLEPGDIIYVPENNSTQFGRIMRIPSFSTSAGVPVF